MFSLRKTALIGLSVSAIALSGCLSSGSSGSSNPVATPVVEDPCSPLPATQAGRIAENCFVVDLQQVEDIEALPGAEVFTGVIDNAGYRIEVPDSWGQSQVQLQAEAINQPRTLVMWAHGFRGETPRLTVDNHPLREYLIANGFAWAASSYSSNFYDVRTGLIDTNKLALAFSDITGADAPDRIIITGASMGGHVTGAAIERDNLQALAQVDLDVNYAGAMPICGVMGDSTLFDYFGGYGVSMLELSGQGTGAYPIPASEAPARVAAARQALWEDYDTDPSFNGLTSEGQALFALLQNLSGGERPMYNVAFGFYQDLLQSFIGSDGSVDGILEGNIVDTSYLRYRFTSQQPGPNMPGNPNELGLTPMEIGFNQIIPQSIPDNNVNPPRSDGPKSVPPINGQFDVPVVSLHNLGDLFVPFSMQQIYRNRAILEESDGLLVQRSIRAIEHCDFSPQELISAFDGLIDWLDNDNIPEGDEVLDPDVVSQGNYGCRFTTENRFTALAEEAEEGSDEKAFLEGLETLEDLACSALDPQQPQ